MRTLPTILLTLTLLVSVPVIAAPTGLYCLRTPLLAEHFIIIDIQAGAVSGCKLSFGTGNSAVRSST